MEFTEREKAVVHLMNMLMNPATKQIPLNLRVQSLAMVCKIRKIPYDEQTMKDMSFAIEDEIQMSVKEAFGFLSKHPEIMNAMKDFKF